jgi:hypothetical protein
VNRDQWAALARGVVSVTAGFAILYAIGAWLSWWVVGAIFVGALADTVWCATRLPREWRPW